MSSSDAFEVWLQKKSLKETAIDSLGRLDISRGENIKDVMEIAISCIAIELIMEKTLLSSGNTGEVGQADKQRSSSMFEAWALWTREKHKFENVSISEVDADLLSPIMKSGDYPLLVRQNDGSYLIESLAYTSSAPKKDDQKKEKDGKKKEAKNVHEAIKASRQQDEIQKNKFYVRELKRVWLEAKVEIERRISEATKQPDASTASKLNRESKSSRNAKSEMALLNALGLKRINEWIEEDEDKERHRKFEKEKEQLKEASESYQAWVKQKEAIDMGLSMYLAGKEFQTWADTFSMKEEKKKLEIWNSFKMYAKEKSQSNDTRKSEEAEKAFENWVLQKDIRDRAVECLAHIDVVVDDEMMDSVSKAFDKDTTSEKKERDQKRVLEVGRALKSIDKTLLVTWAEWCKELFTFMESSILWDFFDPIACDIHSCTQVRDLFNKLMKPKVPYETIFDDFVKDKCRKANKPMNIEDFPLNKEDIQDILAAMSVPMRLADVKILIDTFDVDGNGTICKKEFIELMKPMKEKSCCWRTTCWKTGMPNAFTCKVGEAGMLAEAKTRRLPSGDADLKGESKNLKSQTIAAASTKVLELEKLCTKNRMVDVLPEWEKREKFLRSLRYGRVLDERKLVEFCQYHSKFSDRINAVRADSLRLLYDLSSDNKKEALVRKLMSEGTVPSAPELSCDSGNVDSQLILKWKSAKNDIVSFYSLEFGGLASASKAAVYTEIFCNPKRADEPFKQFFSHEDLEPGCSYLYRIRAFNGFGPGSYTYKKFTTGTKSPAKPKVVKVAHDSVTLRWVFNDFFNNRMDEIKKLFLESDKSSDGQLTRRELADLLQGMDPLVVELQNFLKKKAIELGYDASEDLSEFFDEIECDDSGLISYREFESFLLSAGWCNSQNKDKDGYSVASSQVSALGPSKSKAAIRYILERCKSEHYDKWEVALETSSGQATVVHLDPGCSYRFRVYSKNLDGVRGPASPSVIVHTMLEISQAPTVSGPKGLGSTSIELTWPGRNEGMSTRGAHVIQKVIDDFADAHDEADGGVGLEHMFAKYDLNKNGSIDPKELQNLLEDLGIGVDEDRLNDAFMELDKNRDGEISYAEFGSWWRSDKVVYTIKMSDPIPFLDVARGNSSGTGGSTNSLSSSGSVSLALTSSSKITQKKAIRNYPMKVVHRCPETKYTVTGLEPNSLYHFKTRMTGPRSNSLMSPPLIIMTAPDPPSVPIIVDVSSNCGHFKWYPPTKGGCYSFEVQVAVEDSSKDKEKEWTAVYKGQDNLWSPTTLTPAKKYSIRVFAINYEGSYSKPSPVSSFTTANRSDSSTVIIPKNPESVFPIEATDDICVGDTILITERIFSKDVMTKPPVAPPASDRIIAARTGALQTSRPSSAAAGGKTSVTGKEKEKDQDKGGSVRLDMSTSSIYSESNPLGKYIGQRTLCAVVVKDNFRTVRGSSAASSTIAPSGFYKKFCSNRTVWLEVQWEKLSSDACKPYEINSGSVIERKQAQLEQFEVYRKRWNDEPRRLPIRNELDLLVNCFQTADI